MENKCLSIKTSDTSLEMIAGSNSVATAIRVAVLEQKAKQGFLYNSEEWVEESGDWTAPVSGYYSILAIDGGCGCSVDIGNNKIIGGSSGAYKEAMEYFKQGQIIPITIGAGSRANNNGNADLGGITSVGDIDFSKYSGCFIRGEYNHRDPNNHSTSVVGAGLGGSSYNAIGTWPGAGGGGWFGRTETKPATMQNGTNGAVRFRYYDPAKDPRPTISGIDLPSLTELVQTMKQSETRIAVLEDRWAIPATPNHYSRASLFVPDKTTLTIPAGLQVAIDGKLYQTEQDIPLSTASVKENGKDIYVYACKPASGGSVPDFILTQNSTVPDGYNVLNSRKIGGFHCLCASVGEIANHKLSGYNAGDIIPNSVWDLLHRPISDPEGMVWVKPRNKWMDIYLASWDGSRLVSQFGAVIADGASAKKFHGELFEELFSLTANKFLMSRADFQVGAYGSNNLSVIASDPNTTGGHVDTNNRRMISDYALEDCVGVMWQWTSDLFEGGSYGSINGTTATEISGYTSYLSSIYSSVVDGAANFGTCKGFLRRCLVGGCNGDTFGFDGFRGITATGSSAYVGTNQAARGASLPLTVSL